MIRKEPHEMFESTSFAHLGIWASHHPVLDFDDYDFYTFGIRTLSLLPLELDSYNLTFFLSKSYII